MTEKALAASRSVRRRRLKRAAAVVVLLGVGFAGWYGFIREPDPRNDLERFRGEWQVSIAGRETPNVVRVTGDHWQSSANGIDGRAYRLTVNESTTPKEIDLDPVETSNIRGRVPKLRGVYAFDGSATVRVRVSDTTEPRPATLDDPDVVVWVLKKVSR